MTEKQALEIMYKIENFDFWMQFIKFTGGNYTTEQLDKIRVDYVEAAIEAGTIEA